MKDNIPLYVIAFLFTLSFTVLSARLIIPILKSKAKQPIYSDGPSWHLSKSGTPTMGGLAFVFGITVTLLLCSLYKYIMKENESALSLLICTVYALLNSSVGIIDDITKLKRKENAGLSPRAKLIFQFSLSAIFLLSRQLLLKEGVLPLSPFGVIGGYALYYFLSLVILVGITNCANLTDGIDGLASSVAFAIGISTFYISFGKSDNVTFISAALAAGALGFLVFNIHPALVFMGDTGSLFFGSLIAALGFELGAPWIPVVGGGIYVIEGISVILQVAYYKMTKKRLFKMAPIHHHLERCGWDENKICITAIMLTLLFFGVIVICGIR